MLKIEPVKAFSDNYIWMLSSGRQAFAVDPGETAPVQQYLDEQQLQLAGILITHHHFDHTNGITELATPKMPVYGPAAEPIDGLTDKLSEHNHIQVLGADFRVLEVPGHTAGHIAYCCERENILLCGDTLFSAGCGRLFEGTPAQMHNSLSKFSQLPAEMRIFCTHEYTLSNLQFAAAVEPENQDIQNYTAQVKKWRASDHVSLPSTLGLERAVNPFLRTDSTYVRQQAEQRAGHELTSSADVLAVIRSWKDAF